MFASACSAETVELVSSSMRSRLRGNGLRLAGDLVPLARLAVEAEFVRDLADRVEEGLDRWPLR